MKRLLAIFVVWRNDTILVKNMATLIDKDENVLTDSNDILQQVTCFYEKLYERRDVEDCEISQMVTETDSTFE